MADLKRLAKILGTGTALLMLASAPLHAADDVGKSQSGSNGSAAQTTTGSTTTTTNGAAAANGVATRSATLSDRDQNTIKNIAEANLAEIRAGKLALEKSKNPEIRKFAQMMIDDHTSANNELQTLAQSKGITLPQETDVQRRAATAGMNVLSGNAFDKAYIKFVGQTDHERTRRLLQDTMNNSQDPDLRAYAQKTLQAVNQHKQQADAIVQRMKSKNQ